MPTLNVLYNAILSKLYDNDNSKSDVAWILTRLIADELSLTSPVTLVDTVASIAQLESMRESVKGFIILHCLFSADDIAEVHERLRYRSAYIAAESNRVILVNASATLCPPVQKGFVVDLLNQKGCTWKHKAVTLTNVGSNIIADGTTHDSTNTLAWEDFYSLYSGVIDDLVDSFYKDKYGPKFLSSAYKATTEGLSKFSKSLNDTAQFIDDGRQFVQNKVGTIMAATTAGVSAVKETLNQFSVSFELLWTMLHFRLEGPCFKTDQLGNEKLTAVGNEIEYKRFLDTSITITPANYENFYAQYKSVIDKFWKSGNVLDARMTKSFLNIFDSTEREFPVTWGSEENGITVGSQYGMVETIKVVFINTTTKHVVFIIDGNAEVVWTCSNDYNDVLPILKSILIQMEV